jgi:hypothetical protein
VRTGVFEVVRKQLEAGADVVNDGEYGKLRFLLYAEERLTGFEPMQRSTPSGETKPSSLCSLTLPLSSWPAIAHLPNIPGESHRH